MASDFLVPTFSRLNIPKSFLFLEARLRAYEITSQQGWLTCLPKDLTPVVSKVVHEVLEKPSTTPLMTLERMEEPELEFSRRLRKKLMNRAAQGPHSQKRDYSELDPQTDSDDSSSIILTLETGFDTEQFHTYNWGRFNELPSVAGDFTSVTGEKQHCLSEQAPAIHKRWTRRKRNTQKPEVTNPSKMPQLKIEC